MQNWRDKSRGTQVLKTIMQKNDYIFSILIDELTQSVFTGSMRSVVNQINLRSRKVVKKYPNLKIKSIMCLSSFNYLLLVGGDDYHFTLINITERRVLIVIPVETSMVTIYSSQFNIINRNNSPAVVLSVSGSKSLLLYLYFKFTQKNCE